jgi:hypothetical protein
MPRPPTNRPHRAQPTCKGGKKILSPRLQLPEPHDDAQSIWRPQAILAAIGQIVPIVGQCLTIAARRATTPPPTNRPRQVHQTAHAEHQDAERGTSSPEHADRPRDSAEKLESHRQNHAVESEATRERTAARRDFQRSLTPWPHGGKPPYAYRTKSCLSSGALGWLITPRCSARLHSSPSLRSRAISPYTRRAENRARRSPCPWRTDGPYRSVEGR